MFLVACTLQIFPINRKSLRPCDFWFSTKRSENLPKIQKPQNNLDPIQNCVQAFLDFRGFNFHNFRFNAVYNSILFSSPVVLSNLELRCFYFRVFLSPHINSVYRGMPVSARPAFLEAAYLQGLAVQFSRYADFWA